MKVIYRFLGEHEGGVGLAGLRAICLIYSKPIATCFSDKAGLIDYIQPENSFDLIKREREAR